MPIMAIRGDRTHGSNQQPNRRPMTVNFDDVLTAFERDWVSSAAQDRSGLEEECVVAARRGWDASSPPASWPIAAEPAVRRYFREELTEDVLTTHEEGAARWALFASYATGWLFSLKAQNRLDEQSADRAFAILPGFMWLHEARVSTGREQPD